MSSELTPSYDEVVAENQRLNAIIDEKFDDVRLVRYHEGELVLEGGPIHLIAAYMMEMFTDAEGELRNWFTMTIGTGSETFDFTIQRRGGKIAPTKEHTDG